MKYARQLLKQAVSEPQQRGHPPLHPGAAAGVFNYDLHWNWRLIRCQGANSSWPVRRAQLL